MAWPQSSTSHTGVNQRKRKGPPFEALLDPEPGTKNAVSARLFSAAMACRVVIGEPGFERTDSGGISGKDAARERVHLINRNSHLRSMMRES